MERFGQRSIRFNLEAIITKNKKIKSLKLRSFITGHGNRQLYCFNFKIHIVHYYLYLKESFLSEKNLWIRFHAQ